MKVFVVHHHFRKREDPKIEGVCSSYEKARAKAESQGPWPDDPDFNPDLHHPEINYWSSTEETVEIVECEVE